MDYLPWMSVGGSTVILFNYFHHQQSWNLFQGLPSKRSFFWRDLLSCFSAFKICVSHTMTLSLFLLNRWVSGRTPNYQWPNAFAVSPTPFGIVKDITPKFIYFLRAGLSIDDYLISLGSDSKDLKHWSLTSNGCFTIKSFYNFLIDGGTCYHPSKII